MGTDIARIFIEFENLINGPESNKTRKHHEDKDTFQERFLKDVQQVFDGMDANLFNLLTNISNTSWYSISQHIDFRSNR